MSEAAWAGLLDGPGLEVGLHGPTSRLPTIRGQLLRSPFRDRFPASNLPRSMSVMAILRQSTLPVLQLGQTVGDGVVSNTTLREPTTLFDFKVQGLGLV